MQHPLRIVGWVVCYAFLFLAGLVFVAFLTDGLYTAMDTPPGWDECDDCGAFMNTEATPWVNAALLAYAATWVAVGIWYLAGRRRED